MEANRSFEEMVQRYRQELLRMQQRAQPLPAEEDIPVPEESPEPEATPEPCEPAPLPEPCEPMPEPMPEPEPAPSCPLRPSFLADDTADFWV